MVKIIIVDDESASLNLLGKVIAEMQTDVEVAGLFSTIQYAKAFLEKNSVDIVLSDIKMPGGSGIELAEYIHTNYPLIKMVFFSAYNDFEYAQQAIKFGVKHYLSKPVDINELKTTLTGLSKEVQSELLQKKEQERQQKKYDDLLLMAKTDLYTDILAGFLHSGDEIQLRVQNLDMDKNETQVCHAVIMLRCSDVSVFLDGRVGYYHMFSNLMREVSCIANYINIISLEQEIISVVRFNESISFKDAKDTLERELSWIIESVSGELKAKIEFEIAYTCSTIYELCEYKDMIDNEKLFDIKFRELSSAIFENNYEASKKIFDIIVCYSRTLEISHAKKVFNSMLSYLEKSFSDYLLESDSTFNYAGIWKSDNIDGIIDIAKGIINKLRKEKIVSVKGIETFTIELVKEYIKDNFMNDIVLEDIASYVNLSSYYLSKFFKSKTGQGLSEYITSVRIKEAIELMKTQQYKMYQISEMCGYKSRKYFTHAFKQHVGYTPSEYQRMIGCEPYGVGV